MKAIIADDQAGVRSALRLLLEQQTDDAIINEAANVESLLSQISGGCPDMVLLEVELTGIGTRKSASESDAFQKVVLELRERCPDTCIIALSSHPQIRAQVISCGANAFVCKSEPPEILVDVLDHIWP